MSTFCHTPWTFILRVPCSPHSWAMPRDAIEIDDIPSGRQSMRAKDDPFFPLLPFRARLKSVIPPPRRKEGTFLVPRKSHGRTTQSQGCRPRSDRPVVNPNSQTHRDARCQVPMKKSGGEKKLEDKAQRNGCPLWKLYAAKMYSRSRQQPRRRLDAGLRGHALYYLMYCSDPPQPHRACRVSKSNGYPH